jgi:hypothetical protein
MGFRASRKQRRGRPAPNGSWSARTSVSTAAGVAHWVLRHPLGIDLLVTTLATERPDIKVTRYRIAPEMLSLLDFMIDVLGMRSWPEPQTVLERVRAGFMLMRYAYCLGSGSALPDWRGMYDGLAA